ncbi:hypothetical protein PP175_21770 [Aneurinibacillus sp. Ricciae_BoGa-3]|uniref:hypothetical protein n=1 Tax=Aneurinibacillus sp. Ricciae_BoGa-3 TaxID=3022697 RepID=UPI00233FBB96|nr:hypothetical protein [Aneurinibacillus sp. Ricciae_BoGa-3]WCK53920.1 hypothetical protein PP175_21770 [Aneurinibacillus sp. Ricciae_BoGa-3]
MSGFSHWVQLVDVEIDKNIIAYWEENMVRLKLYDPTLVGKTKCEIFEVKGGEEISLGYCLLDLKSKKNLILLIAWIDGYRGKSNGKIWSPFRGRFLRTYKLESGYRVFNCKGTQISVHRFNYQCKAINELEDGLRLASDVQSKKKVKNKFVKQLKELFDSENCVAHTGDTKHNYYSVLTVKTKKANRKEQRNRRKSKRFTF